MLSKKGYVSYTLKQITCFFFALLALITVISAPVWADFVPGEIIVGFQQGVIELPNGKLDSPIRDVVIKSPVVRQLCVAENVIKIERVFKSRAPGVTTAISRTGEVVDVPDLSQVYKLIVPVNVDVKQTVKVFQALNEVGFAEPNYIVEPLSDYPNDGYFQSGAQWGLYNYGQDVGKNDADVDAPEAWGITKGSASVVIAIVDSGVDATHQDLNAKIIGGETGIEDDDPHGTEVAGVAAAETDNGQGVAGLAWECKIMPRRAPWQSTELADDIVAAADDGADIINMSWVTHEYSIILDWAIHYAAKHNVVLVAGSGEDDDYTLVYPAASNLRSTVIAVSATDRADRWSGGNLGSWIDVAAPGFVIWTTTLNNTYFHFNGTSLAAPFVSGLAGLMLSQNPGLHNEDVHEIIRNSADDIEQPGWDEKTGMGRINAHKALLMLQSPYSLYHEIATGGYEYEHTDFYQMVLNVPDLPSGTYMVKRYEMRCNVTYQNTIGDASYVPDVWGRRDGSVGWNSSNPNYGITSASVVPGTETHTGCTLRSYVYDVWTTGIPSVPLGWYPCPPSECDQFAYTIFGWDGDMLRGHLISKL